MGWRETPRPWPREAWEDWARELVESRHPDKLIESIADMGEQVEMLHAVRLAAFGEQVAVPLEIPEPSREAVSDLPKGQVVIRGGHRRVTYT